MPVSRRVLRVAVVGAGGIVRSMHGPALRDLARRDRRLRLAAICDLDPARAGEAARQFGFARTFEDPLEMLDAVKPDAVWVAVPPSATSRIAGAVLERGFPALVEKPPGRTPGELEALLRAARTGRATAMVAFNRRHIPLVAAARARLAILRRADPRAPLQVLSTMRRVGRHDADFAATAIHLLDTLAFLAGSPLAGATILRAPASRRHPAQNALVSGHLRDGSLFSAEILPDCGHVLERHALHLAGTTLDLRLPLPRGNDGAGTLREWNGGGLVRELDGTKAAASCAIHDQFGFRDMARAFLAAARAGRTPRDSLASARESVSLADALRRGRRAWRARATARPPLRAPSAPRPRGSTRSRRGSGS